MPVFRPLAAVLLALSCAAAVSCSDGASNPQTFDASRVRRVFEPPPGGVRAVPPHAIRSEGVGPYLLGAPLKDILAQLPRGPRVVLMEIDRVVDYSLVEAEHGSLIIGAQRPGVSFVTVLDKEIARTENDVGVDTSVKELRNVMGPESRSPGRLRDPRILVFDYLPNTRFLIEKESVAAVLVDAADKPNREGASAQVGDDGATDRDAGPASTPSPGCPTAAVGEHEKDILRVARMQDKKLRARVVGGCFGGGAIALAYTNSRLVVVAGEPGKLRRVAQHSLPNLVFAGPIDIDGDGRFEIAAVAHTVSPEELVDRVELFRFEGARLNRLAARDAYKVTAMSATWIGARLDQIDLLLEIHARFETLYLGGLYVQRSGERTRSVAPLLPVKLAIRPKRPVPGAAAVTVPGTPSDAGAKATPPKPAKRDAGVAPKAKRSEAPGR